MDKDQRSEGAFKAGSIKDKGIVELDFEYLDSFFSYTNITPVQVRLLCKK